MNIKQVENKENNMESSTNNNYNSNFYELAAILEALLLSAGKPMSIQDLLIIFDEPIRPEPEAILAALTLLQEKNSERGIRLIKTVSGYQFVTKKEHAHFIAKLWQEKPGKYSRALLETLALIAYRQPITRGEIEQIRGVTISPSIFKTLQDDRAWIKVIGYKDAPGKPGIYATTKEFLTYFGLEKLEQLPPLPKIMELLETQEKINN